MTLPRQGVRMFFPRSLLHIKPCVRTYFGTKYSSCRLNARIDRKCDPRILSRSFSKESFINYPSALFNWVAESEVSAFTKDFFVCIHDVTGLPWWGTIAASAAIMKLYSVPWMIYQLKLADRLRMIKDEMPNIIEKAYREVRVQQYEFSWTPETAKKRHKLKVMTEKKKLIEKNNCHPLKVILMGYMEVPVWIMMSMTWRTMAYGFSHDIPSSKVLISQMMTEGPFWCVNLTLPDPNYVSSLLVLLAHFAVLDLSHVQAKLLKKDAGTVQKVLRILFRILGILAAILCSAMPSSVAVFWFFSMMLTLMRDMCFISPKVRTALKLPCRNFSYREVFETWKNKYLDKLKVIRR